MSCLKTTKDYREFIRKLFYTNFKLLVQNQAICGIRLEIEEENQNLKNHSQLLDKLDKSVNLWQKDEYEATIRLIDIAESEFNASEILAQDLSKIGSEIVKVKQIVTKKQNELIELQHCFRILNNFFPQRAIESLTPQDLITVIKERELSCLRGLDYQKHNHNYLHQINSDLETVTNSSNQIQSSIIKKIHNLQKTTQEQKLTQLKTRTHKILSETQSKTINEETTNLIINLTEAYNKTVSTEELSPIDMIRAIDTKIQKMGLHGISEDTMKAIELHIMRTNRKK